VFIEANCLSRTSDRLLLALGGRGVDRSESPWGNSILVASLLGPLLLEWTKQYSRGTTGSIAPLSCLLAGVCLLIRLRLIAIAIGLGVAIWGIGFTLPMTPNHAVALAVSFVFLLWDALENDTSYRASELIRWLAFTILFWSGLQKVLHGAYFNGTFFSTQLALGDRRFAWMQSLCSASELQVLGNTPPSGPFVPGCRKITWMSSMVVCLEFAMGGLLLVPRLRSAAAGLAMIFLVFVQVVTKEITFALTMCSVLSVFLDKKTAERLCVLIVVISLAFSWTLMLHPELPYN